MNYGVELSSFHQAMAGCTNSDLDIVVGKNKGGVCRGEFSGGLESRFKSVRISSIVSAVPVRS